jgi:multiple sugar transport system permease protein
MCIWSIFPIYWAINTSFLSTAQAQNRHQPLLPIPPYLDNYKVLFGQEVSPLLGSQVSSNFHHSLINSLVEAIGGTIVTVVFATLGAYAFARMNFVFKNVIFYAVLATLTLPTYAILIPLYQLITTSGLGDTWTGIIITDCSVFLPLAMWILYAYFGTIPKSLEEAAHIDGAGPFTTLIRIIIPLARPAIVSTTIIVFLLCWGIYLLPLVLSSSFRSEPLTVWVTSLQGQHTSPSTILNTVGVLTMLIPIAIVIFLSRHIVRGLLAGSSR